MILHIAHGDRWRGAQVIGAYDCRARDGAPFIHCSTGRQVRGPWRAFYADTTDLVMLLIDERALTAPVRYEAASPRRGRVPTRVRINPRERRRCR